MAERKSWNIVFDSHFHLNGSHEWTQPVTEFKKAGGTALNLVNLPDYSVPVEGYYEVLYDRTVRAAESLRKDYGLHVLVSLGPYPLDYFHFRTAGMDPESNMMKGLELASKYIEDGRANGFGEVGRPHFPVDSEVLNYSNSFITEVMERARDIDTFIMLHTEDLNEESTKGIADMARKVGISLNRVIKHHSTVEILGTEKDMSKTLLATRSNTRFIMENENRAMLESDFVDDPEKPGKVIPADSVPKRAVMIRNESPEYEKILYDVFQELPYRAFRDDYFTS